MLLPGGFQDLASARSSRVSFAKLNGLAELSLWESLDGSETRPEKVTQILDIVFNLGDEGRTSADLCAADRDYLLSQYALSQGITHLWLSSTCNECGTQFDVPVDLQALPVKSAGANYGNLAFEHGEDSYKCHIPIGADLAKICDLPQNEALISLARLCFDDPLPDDLNLESILDKLDARLEETAPEIPTSILATCPDCKTEVQLDFDIAKAVIETFENPLEDVHDIASAYHWNETQILQLPRSRRQAYLKLIDDENGITR